MNEAKHLLERTAYFLGFADWVPEYDKLRKEIEYFLSTTEPEAKSLSDEEIVQAYEDASFIGTMTAFVAGIRYAEKHHGIGEK